MGKPLLNESVLLMGVVAGDERTFRTIFDHYQQDIYTFAQKITRSNADAEEVVQDIFLKVWFNRDHLANIDNFGAYLNRLVRNHALNLLRHEAIVHKAKAEIKLSTTEEDLATQQILDYNETKEILDDVVRRLPEQQRKVYAMCHVDGLKYNEVAEQLNISSDTVHYHMKLALATIREHFKKNAVVYPALVLSFFTIS